MVQLERKKAISILSLKDLLNLEDSQRKAILLDIYSEDEAYKNIQDHTASIYNQKIVEYLEDEYKGITNEYISLRLNQIFQSNVKVFGKIEELLPCLCCGYKTIDSRGEYDICKVCFWEDDGTDDRNQYSCVNHMTLKKAQENFIKTGAMDEKFLKKIDAEGTQKYPK